MLHKLTPRPVSDGPRRLFAEPSDRIISRADSEALFKRIVAMATGGGDTQVTIRSTWLADMRWARNRPISSEDTIEQFAVITRFLYDGRASVTVNQFDDDSRLKNVLQRLEKQLALQPGDGSAIPLEGQKYLDPPIWSEATYQVTAQEMSDTVRKSVDPVVDAKLVAAGYASIGAVSWAIFNTRGLNAYAAATGAMYTETVRMPDGSGSGWVGKSHSDWAKLDPLALSAVALQKGRDSAHPVKIEPGRYTAILEPKAAGILMFTAVKVMDRQRAESDSGDPYHDRSSGKSKIGLQVMDSRISIISDPMDPDCSFIPFDAAGYPYRRVTWVEKGILKELPYDRQYANSHFQTDTPLPNPEVFRMTGGNTSIEEMIASTERGIYVTHFGSVRTNDRVSLDGVSVTQDGLWLIEHGRIVSPIKNLWINDSPLIVFNQVVQLGVPVRTIGVAELGWEREPLRNEPPRALHDGNIPMVAPPVKVNDFNFTRLTDAI